MLIGLFYIFWLFSYLGGGKGSKIRIREIQFGLYFIEIAIGIGISIGPATALFQQIGR